MQHPNATTIRIEAAPVTGFSADFATARSLRLYCSRVGGRNPSRVVWVLPLIDVSSELRRGVGTPQICNVNEVDREACTTNYNCPDVTGGADNVV